MIGQVKNNKPDDNAHKRGDSMAAAKKNEVKPIKYVPGASPNKYQANNDRKIFAKVA